MDLSILMSHRRRNSTAYVIGLILIGLGIGMIPCLLSSMIHEESLSPFLAPVVLCLVIGTSVDLLFRMPDIIRPVDGLVMVAAMWVVAIAVGSIPFMLAGMPPVDAIFESTSGITTTGSTIMADIESWPYGILLWRSVMQWIGGIAIIIIFMMILPMLGFGGRDLFGNETSGSGAVNFSIKMRDAAKQFIVIYLILTVILLVILLLLGVNIYEGLCLSLSTVSTGGFMCKGDSVIGYRSLVKVAVMIFMFLGGTNFYLHFKAVYRADLEGYTKNEEFRTMLLLNIGFIIFAFLIVCGWQINFTQEEMYRLVDVGFNIVSASTTTGFAAADYDAWMPTAVMLMFVAMLIGGSSGSTSGGLKIGRLLVTVRFAYNGLKEMLHPRAVYDIRLNGSSLDSNTIYSAVTVFIVFFVTVIIGAAVLMLSGMDFQLAMTTMVANLTTFGPATGPFGAVGSYQDLQWFIKLFLSVVMWLGRLEILTGLILLTPGFWKEYMMSRRKQGSPAAARIRR